MAELTMLKGNTALAAQSASFPAGKEIQKGKTDDKNASSADFSDFLRASKEEGREKEEIHAGKEKKDSPETEKRETGVKAKKPEERKIKKEDAEELSLEQEMENLLTENSFLIRRDQLKVEMQTKSEDGPGADSVSAVLSEEPITEETKELVSLKEVLSPIDGQKDKIAEKNAFSLEGKAEEEKLPLEENKGKDEIGLSKDKLRPEREAVQPKREKKTEEKDGERIARTDLKKEETHLGSAQKAEAPIKSEPETVYTEKKVEYAHLLTKEEALPKDVAEFIGEKIDFRKGEIKIELEPRSLGQITVKLNFQSGKASIVIFAENPKTLHILQNGAEDMARIVEQKTGEQTKVVVHEENLHEELFRDNDSHSKENRDEAERRLREAEEEKNKNRTEGFIHRMRLGIME